MNQSSMQMQPETQQDSTDMYAQYAAIEASDAAIAAAVREAEVPPLLAALALVNGDPQMVPERLQPPLPPMGATIAPQGGLSAAALEEARALATEGVIAFRDRATAPLAQPDDALLHDVMRFVTNGEADGHLPLLRHELALPEDYGSPGWTKSDAAPDTDFHVAVIGAGISGLAAARRLQQAGLDFTVFEKNLEVGGTWWENIYPGCRLDTPNFAYSYSFAQKPDWTEQFSRQHQIQEYLTGVASDFGLRQHVKLGTRVLEATFDGDDLIWHLVTETNDGVQTNHRFHAVITAVGQLNLPNIPDIPGSNTFAGTSFHSAQWDPGVDLTAKNVVLIGTGASAFQIAPSIVDRVANLSIFQRNAPWMLPTPTYHAQLPDGMQWLLQRIPFYGRCFRFWQFWLAAEGRLPFVTADPEWTQEGTTSAMNAQLRDGLLEALRSQVIDRPDLLEKMTPTYPPGAKRMTRDNGVWAETLKQTHVQLETSGIERIVPEGVVDRAGRLHPADVIVYATGFRASDYLEPMVVRGLDGIDLHEKWDGDAKAYLGVNVSGFPNLFMLMGPNTGVVVNGSSLFMAECAAEYALKCLGTLLQTGSRAMDVTESAVDDFCEQVDAENSLRAWGVANVNTWYRNSRGRASQVWPFSLTEFFNRTREPDMRAYRCLGGQHIRREN